MEKRLNTIEIGLILFMVVYLVRNFTTGIDIFIYIIPGYFVLKGINGYIKEESKSYRLKYNQKKTKTEKSVNNKQ